MSGASRCDHESSLGNGPMGCLRFIEIIHAFNREKYHSFREEKMQNTRDLRSRIGKTENIEASWSTGCSKMAVRR